ncbi:MAG: PAS domain-containing sensor histidine kinase [Puniceicoccales bacterium]|jgi:signal transduction histidine kinase|nr:PAS domain-containing sensor histidine kinase [Puniceicoccales bacterium]
MPAPRKRYGSLDRILGRIDDLDPANLAILVQRLAGERALLETVFNTIQEGVLVIGAGGVIEYSNMAANEIVGLRESDVGRAVFWKLVPGLAHSLGLHFDAGNDTCTAAPAITREVEITYPELRHVRLHLSRLDCEGTTPGGEIIQPRHVVILRDITEEKISTEDLLESERTNSILTLAAGVAHEIGNPLNSINIHLQLIQRRLEKAKATPNTERISESISVCATEIKRLDDIIHHFLEAIRPSHPDLQDIQLLGIIAEVFALLKTQCEDLDIRVTVSIGQDLPVISGDRNQLKQVFFNLMKNAMEAMGQGGRIDIAAEADDEYVHVRIADTGAGIDCDALSRIFEPFFTTKAGGHGLGMMVVVRILRAHGALIGIESVPGQGTTVSLQFPQKHRRIKLLRTEPREPVS